MKTFYRQIPVFIILICLAAFFYFGFYRYLSFDSLKNHRDALIAWREQYYVLSVFIFMFIYTVSVAISVPGASILSLVGGFLFGTVLGTFFIVFSATIGASLLFFSVKTALGDYFYKKTQGKLKKMEKGFRENAFYYLLSLRLIPIFPFWLVNIVPALLKVPFKKFLFATFLGIIPGSAVYAALGASLHTVFLKNERPNLDIIFSPSILIPLLALGLLSLVPIMYKKLKSGSIP